MQEDPTALAAIAMQNILFCGNPGYGKSTICNCIFQSAVFESGISTVTGMTRLSQNHVFEGCNYIDTPGLSDVTYRKEAGMEITKALKHNGRYKIIFVIILISGRVSPNDLSTIIAVCDAIKINFEYGIIFNKMTPNAKEMVKQKLDEYIEVLPKKPRRVLILGRIEDADDVNNHVMNLSVRAKIMEFTGSLMSYTIRASDVNNINTLTFGERLRKVSLDFYQTQLARERQALAAQERTLDTAVKSKRHTEDGLVLKEGQKSVAQRATSKNDRELCGLKKEDNESNAWFAGAGAVGVAGAGAAAVAAAAGAVVAAPIVIPAAAVSATVMALFGRSKKDNIKGRISSLTLINSQLDNSIYSYNQDIRLANEQINLHANTVKDVKGNIDVLRESIKELEGRLAAL